MQVGMAMHTHRSRVRKLQPIHAPALTSIPCPVTELAPGDISQETERPISWGVLMRPKGTGSMAIRWASSRLTPIPAAMPSMPSQAMSVSTQPGQTALTRMCWGAYSKLSALTSPSSAVFDAQYPVYPGTPKRPRIEEITTIWRASGPGAKWACAALKQW